MSNLPNSLNPSVRLVTIIFSIGVVLGSGLGYGFYQTTENANLQDRSKTTENPHFNRVEYERLQLGMSLTDVEAILYRGIEVNRSTTMATFVWENSDGSKISAIFENGKLKSKEQTGLK
ncbi:MAG: hypothetical protein ACYTXT_32795 [Nostoc sp.]